MNCSRIGVPIQNGLPKRHILRFRTAQICTTMDLVRIVHLPRDAMSSKRPNLTLDEQSFQGLLSAAFTIQEHNERLKQDREAQAEPVVPQETAALQETEAHLEKETTSVCPHCGAPKPADLSRCESCGRDEFRPGERLQRSWASMWLISQEQSLWPERSSEIHSSEIREGMEKDGPALGGLTLDEPAPGNPILNQAATQIEWPRVATAGLTEEDLAREYSDRANPDQALQPVSVSARDDTFPADDGNDDDSSFLQRFWEAVSKLRDHRADLYLGVALVVAVLALLWPAAGSPRQAALSLWERSLVELGIAEAPAPVVHVLGDPGIEVWVDPHTALYYCPGEELYGKTANGRVSTQRDAQMDRFEPAGRSPCE